MHDVTPVESIWVLFPGNGSAPDELVLQIAIIHSFIHLGRSRMVPHQWFWQSSIVCNVSARKFVQLSAIDSWMSLWIIVSESSVHIAMIKSVAQQLYYTSIDCRAPCNVPEAYYVKIYIKTTPDLWALQR